MTRSPSLLMRMLDVSLNICDMWSTHVTSSHHIQRVFPSRLLPRHINLTSKHSSRKPLQGNKWTTFSHDESQNHSTTPYRNLAPSPPTHLIRQNRTMDIPPPRLTCLQGRHRNDISRTTLTKDIYTHSHRYYFPPFINLSLSPNECELTKDLWKNSSANKNCLLTWT